MSNLRILAPLVFAFTTALAFAASAQNAPGIASGGVQYAVSPNSGQVSASYPFELPKARGRYQPSLSRDYKQLGHTGVLAWGLSYPYIEIQPGAPVVAGIGVQIRGRFTLYLNGRRITLIPDPLAAADHYTGEIVTDVQAAAACSSGTGPQCYNSWTLKDSEGNVYTFMGSVGGPWAVQHVVDVDGNAADYTYSGVSAQGVPILIGLQYNYYDRTQPANTGSLGGNAAAVPSTLVQIAAAQITVQHQTGNPPAASPIYGWTIGDTGNVTQIARVQYNASGAVSQEPPTVFQFEDSFTGLGSGVWQEQSFPQLTQANGGTDLLTPNEAQCSNWAGVQMTKTPVYGESSDTVVGYTQPCTVGDVATWIDIDADGRPDLVWGDSAGIRWARNLTVPGGPLTLAPVEMIAGSAGFFHDQTTTFSQPPQPLGLSSLNKGGTATLSLVDSAGKTRTFEGIRLMDFDGDGRLDLVGSGGQGGVAGQTGCSPNRYAVRFNRDVNGVPVFQTEVCTAQLASPPQGNVLLLEDGPANYNTSSPFPQTSISMSVGGGVFYELADANGDGIVDIVEAADNGTGRYYIYPGFFAGTEWGFSQFGSLVTVAAPLTLNPAGWYPLHLLGGAVLDYNGDGIADWHGYSEVYDPQGTVTTLPLPDACAAQHQKYAHSAGVNQVGFGTGAGMTFQQTAAREWPSWPMERGPTGALQYTDLNLFCPTATPPGPLSAFPDPAQIPHPNAAGTIMQLFGTFWIDVDGDGIMDYVIGSGGADLTNGGLVYRGSNNQPGVKGQVLKSISTPQGAVYTFDYTYSSDFGAGPNIPIYSVLRNMTVTGLGMEPSTTRYWYANPRFAAPLDGTNRSESLGFGDVWQENSVSLEVIHTQFAANHAFLGMPVSTTRGSASGFGSDPVAPPVFVPGVVSTAALSTRNVRGGTCTGMPNTPQYPAPTDYPVVVFVSSAVQTTTDGAGHSISATDTVVQCADVDNFGHVLKHTVVADTQSADSLLLSTSFASPPCWSCVLEESKTDSAGKLLFDRKYNYDDVTSHFHLVSISEWMSGSGTAAAYETPETTSWNGNGTVQSVTRLFTNQPSTAATAISSSVKTYTYDSCQMYVTRLAVTDNLLNEIDQDSTYDARGFLTAESYPHAPSETPAFKYYSYDGFNRVAAIGSQAPSPPNVLGAYTAFEYTDATATTPGSVTVSEFAVSTTFVLGSVPVRDDVTKSVTYSDGLGRPIQSRTRIGSGAAAIAGANIVPAGIDSTKALVESSVVYDGAGRVRASIEPYFASGMTWVDPHGHPSELLATRATVTGYDGLSRPSCIAYRPVSGTDIPAAVSDPALCTNSFAESPSYTRATAIRYSFETVSGLLYATVDVTQPWNLSGSSTRAYVDASGRRVYARDGYGNYMHSSFDLMSRETGAVRFAGLPNTTPQVSFTRTYDARSRVIQETDDSAGIKSYAYLPGGELVCVQQGAASALCTAATSGTLYTIGSLGRMVQRDRFRQKHDASCAQTTEHTIDTYHFDVGYGGAGATDPYGLHYNFTSGRLAWETNDDTTIAYGYTVEGHRTVRDQKSIASGTDVHSVSRTVGNDGRTLTATFQSTYLPSAVNFVHSYDSAGNLAQVADNTGTTVYWKGNLANATGVADALGRVLQSTVDTGAAASAAGIVNTVAISPFSGTVGRLTAAATGGNVLYDAASTYLGTQLASQTVKSVVDPSGGSVLTATYDNDGRLTQAASTGLQSYTHNFSHFISQTFSSGGARSPACSISKRRSLPPRLFRP